MARMRARYASFCRLCNRRIHVGDSIWYAKGTKAVHIACHEGSPDAPKPADETRPTKRPKPAVKGMKSFLVDWLDLKKVCLAAYEGNYTRVPNHVSDINSAVVNPGSWQGYSGAELQRWLKSGYKSEAIQGLGDFSPPLREKRKLRYVEEGDEFHYDLAASGDDRFMSEWTKRETIPGAIVEVSLGFCSSVSAATVIAYNRWVCKAIYALESAGIDTEISVHHCADNMVSGETGPHDTRVRVKKQNEAIDFMSFSAMLGPAQWRSLMFTAMFLHCEDRGRKISGGYGHGRNWQKEWECHWDNETRRLNIGCHYDGSTFPEAKMTADFRKAVHAMSGKKIH